VIGPALLPGVVPAVLLLSSEEGEHAAEKFLGIPMTVWQLINLVLFAAVLVYFVARPLSSAFRKRQDEIEERRRQAEKQRADAQKLTAEIRERTARIERDIEEIRRQGVTEGERARAELSVRSEQEAARAIEEAQEEIGRRLEEAKTELRRAAAGLTAERAKEILSREITDEDRRRLIEDGVDRLKQSTR
jgi:F-type H+-transporting ATPase subunit b